ncbi:Dihydropteridine reductase [Orchesella cincta]|uniref:Dihydropteridine reductase n=1 Tax=Orchesella cincta TaxID=48709 RepID=A0A1D2M9S4_ORCCI|nr:Dihydropteridine reductase [Orchesella cincta]
MSKISEDKKQLLVIGGRGALGQAIVRHFKEKNVWVASVDHGSNEEADLSLNIKRNELHTTLDQAQWIEQKLKESLQMDAATKTLDGIICVAGGWMGGNVATDDFLKSVDMMWKQSVESSVVAAYLARRFLKEGGLLVMTGAQAAAGPTPTMIGYGMAKAAVHHLIKSLAAEGSGLPRNCVVVGLLPRTLDTPNNRKFATGNEDYGSWTPLSHITGLLEKWLGSQNKDIQTAERDHNLILNIKSSSHIFQSNNKNSKKKEKKSKKMAKILSIAVALTAILFMAYALPRPQDEATEAPPAEENMEKRKPENQHTHFWPIPVLSSRNNVKARVGREKGGRVGIVGER